MDKLSRRQWLAKSVPGALAGIAVTTGIGRALSNRQVHDVAKSVVATGEGEMACNTCIQCVPRCNFSCGTYKPSPESQADNLEGDLEGSL